MKVYEVAKDLNLKSVQLLEKLRKEHNMAVKKPHAELKRGGSAKNQILFFST